MGRDIGTNVYSNNFEPQVMGLLDARGKAATKADLTTTAQWTSTDGNIYAPKAILVAVTDDPIASNNGLYMLKGDDYSVASNWMQINGENVSSNVKVLTTGNLIDSSRTSAVQLSSEDVSTLRSATSQDVFVYNGVIGSMTTTIPLTITFTQPPATALQMVISYAFIDRTYYIAVSATDTTQKDVLYADAPREMPSGGGGGKTEKISIPFATIRDLAENANTTSSDIVATIGQDNLDKLCNFYLPLDIEMPGLYGDGPMYARKNYMMGIPNNLAVYINTLENKMFVLHKINDEYKLNVFPQIIFDSTIEPSSNNAPQNKAVYNALKTKQDTLVSGKNIKTINGQSLLGSGNIAISGSGGGSSEAAYLTTLDLWGTITSDPLSQDEYDEIINIFNKWKAGIPIVVSMRDHYNGILNISTNRGDITEKSTISFSITKGDTIEIWSILMKVGSYWERVYKILPTEISLYDIVAKNATDLLTSNGEELYDSIMMLDILALKGIPIYANYFDSLSGHYPISIRESFPSFVVNYSGREFQIDYQINRDNTITYSVTDVTKHDLSIDVKTYSPQGIVPKIYFRIKEIVPNGRIHFVRKKRMRYFDRNDNLIRSLGYAVMEADCHHEAGVDVSTLSPNIWYEYPIIGTDLISSYPPGSSENGKKRTHGVIRFKGATYAKSFEFKNAPFTQMQTTLHAGLQYNVLSGKKSPLFKERGEVVPIDVRLRILSTSNYNAGYEYSYVVQ